MLLKSKWSSNKSAHGKDSGEKGGNGMQYKKMAGVAGGMLAAALLVCGVDRKSVV